MDKFEFKVKYEEIRNLYQEKKYAEAAAIADTIDWSRKKPNFLMQIADIYKKNRRYDDAIELLLLAYERMPSSKDVCFSLCELYIKTNNVIKAVEFYKEFNKVASNDSRKYILKYLIYAMQDVAIGERITVLEDLKNCDYTERWAYELAFLYYRAGLKTKCVEECDELITWFGDGKYAYKTMELKMLCGQPLTPEQQEKYDHRFDVFKDSRWDGLKVGKGDSTQTVSPVNNTTDNSANGSANNDAGSFANNEIQAEVPAENAGAEEYASPETENVQQPEQIMTGYEALSEDEQKENAALMGQTIAYTPVRDMKAEDLAESGIPSKVGTATDPGSAEAIALSMGYTQVYHGMNPEPDIQVKQVDVGEYNTINLQKALAEGVAEVLNGSDTGVNTPDIIKADTKKIIGVDTDSSEKIPEGDVLKDVSRDSSQADVEPHSIDDATVEIARVSGTFTATRTIPFHDIQNEVRRITKEEEKTEENEEQAVVVTEETAKTEVQPDANEEISERKLTQVIPQNTSTEEKSEITSDNHEKLSDVEARAMSAQPPESLAEVLTQEDDGQISFVMPEDHTRLARQITGQLSISDVMAEWNRMKVEREEANRKKFHEQVKQQTGEIFNEFEKEALNGVLETLSIGSGEKPKIIKTYEPSGRLGKIDYNPIESTKNDINVINESNVEIGNITEDAASVEIETAETDLNPGNTVKDVTEPDDDQVEELTDIIQPAESSEDIDMGLGDWKAAENSEDEESVEEIAEEPAEVSEEESAEEPTEVSEEESAEEFAEASEEEPAEEFAEVSEEEYADEPAEASEEEPAEAFEEESAEVSEEKTEETSEEESEEKTVKEPAVRTRKVLGLNETTELFIRKKNQKIAEKVAAENSDSSKEEKDDTRELTDDEKTLFGPYVQSKDSKKQLVSVLDNVSMASYTGNIIITGGDDNDTSDLAINIMKYLKQTDSNFSGKVAKTSARSLNNRKIEAVVKQLANGALIVEGASGISDETIAAMSKCLEQENLGIIISLIDNERNIEKLVERAPKLTSMFTARMNIKPLTKDQLAEYAVKYAYDKEYSIDQMGMLALHKQIDAKQTSTHSVNVFEVKEIVDKAIEHVNRKTIGHFFDVFGGKRYDEEDMIILGEKDFRN